MVDAAIVDGVASLSQSTWSMLAEGSWIDRREANPLDGGAPFYGTYLCADGGYVAIGAIEPQFYALLLQALGLSDVVVSEQWDRASWPRTRERIAVTFATRTRDEWMDVFDGTDACVSPVLSLAEAAVQPHLVARQTLTTLAGVTQAAPAPRFSRTPAGPISRPPTPGADSEAVVQDWSRDRG